MTNTLPPLTQHKHWRGAFLGAYNKGRDARSLGKARSTCPYDQSAVAIVGRGRHSVTFERGFANAWYDGWTNGLTSRSEKPT